MIDPGTLGQVRAAQARFVAAMVGATPPPEGVNAPDFERARAALQRKRARALARAWPGLSQALGGDLPAQFDRFARDTPLPARGGALADGRAFLAWLKKAGCFPTRMSFDVMLVDLRFRQSSRGLDARTGPSLRCTLHDPRWRVCFGIRAAFAGRVLERIWRLGQRT